MSRKELRERAWQQMEILLEQEMPERKRRSFAFYLPYAAAIMLLGIITSTLFYQNRTTVQFSELESNPLKIERIGNNVTPEFLRVDKEKSLRKAANMNQAKKFSNQILKTEYANVFIVEQVPAINSNSVAITETAYTTNLLDNLTEVNDSDRIKESSSSTQKQVISTGETKAPAANSDQKSVIRTVRQPNTENNTGLVSNQRQQQTLFLTPEIRKSFQPGRDMGVTSNGTIGLVSENMEEYGLRMGIGIEKPIGKKFSANTAIRYSIYKDDYSSTYQVDTPEELMNQLHISRMRDRSVSRSFIEVPVYGTYNLTKNLAFKTGVSATYNKNKSESPGFTTQAVVNNSYISEEAKQEIGRLYNDENGYLGEYLIGASLELEKVTFEVEATRGFINSQSIDNRNIIGMRIGYKFGK